MPLVYVIEMDDERKMLVGNFHGKPWIFFFRFTRVPKEFLSSVSTFSAAYGKVSVTNS